MNTLKLLILLGFAALLAGCAGVQVRPITPDEVVEMAKSGMPADAIIARLKESRTVYQVSAADLVKLHEQGVPTPVLDYMQSTYLDAVREEESRRAFFYRRPPYWYGSRYYDPWWW